MILSVSRREISKIAGGNTLHYLSDLVLERMTLPLCLAFEPAIDRITLVHDRKVADKCNLFGASVS